MKHYLIEIEEKNQQLWDTFRNTYKEKGLGQNLTEAIITMIKNELER